MHLKLYKIKKKIKQQQVDKSGEFNNRTMELIFENNDKENLLKAEIY